MDTFNLLFEASDDVGIMAMSLRALIIFVATLIFLRIAGRRSFGQKTAFDLCVTVLLGAVLSRAIVGASPMMPALAAGAVLVLAHRLLAILAIRWEVLDRLINGSERKLIENGRKDQNQMRAALVSERDIDEALRKKSSDASVESVLYAILERNGEITIIPRSSK
ncbi:MAG: rane protein [Herbaspirillum sp.]|nr:rane protein [Herbaspirillum sp.]